MSIFIYSKHPLGDHRERKRKDGGMGRRVAREDCKEIPDLAYRTHGTGYNTSATPKYPALQMASFTNHNE